MFWCPTTLKITTTLWSSLIQTTSSFCAAASATGPTQQRKGTSPSNGHDLGEEAGDRGANEKAVRTAPTPSRKVMKPTTESRASSGGVEEYSELTQLLDEVKEELDGKELEGGY